MKILHLEDSPADAELVSAILAEEFPACRVTVVANREHFLAGLASGAEPDLVLSDFSLPGFDGLAALTLTRERTPGIPFVFLSGSIGEERAILAVRSGAYDYVLKDSMARLPVVIRRALEESAQRRHHEEDDRRLRELAGIIERAGEAIVVSEMDGRITLWNDGACRLYGLPAATALGQTFEALFPGTELGRLRTARETTPEKDDWRGEIQLITRDGRELVVDFRKTLVLDEAGRPSARLSIGTDITERKKLEEQFLRAQRLESLGLLAAGIAHDFNNVLAPIVMAAPLLRQRATDTGDLRILDILEKSAERGAGLVRQILGFARGAGGGLQFTQVKHLLKDVGDVVRASFPKSIVLDENVPGDLWPIQANPTQIHQVLLNLAVNARDAMLPRGGTLRFRAENRVLDDSAARALDGARPGTFLVLVVADTGTGMTPEVLARIWQPFFTTKSEGQGTGLGLSTVRGIAAAHGGFVTVESRLGHGTTFQVFLPAAKPAETLSATAPRLAALRGHGELLLVVDDDPGVRDLTTTILTHYGYRTIGCSDGVEAIGLFTEHGEEIRAVVSDMNMPNLDGPALALVLKRLQPGVRILAISGLGSTDTLDAAPVPNFATAKLQKPFTAEALLTAVHRLLHPAAKPPAA